MSRKMECHRNSAGEPHIELGWLIKSVMVLAIAGALTALATAVIGFPSLANDVKAQQEELNSLEASQHVIVQNQRVIDEEVRNLKADSALAQNKLDAVLKALKVTEQFRRPPPEPTRLEDPKDE